MSKGLETVNKVERIPQDQIQVGEWYWVKQDKTELEEVEEQSTYLIELLADNEIEQNEYDESWDENETRRRKLTNQWLGCVTKVGSNFIGLRSIGNGHGHSTIRIHVDDIDEWLTKEPNSLLHIREQVEKHETTIESKLLEIQQLALSLGLQDFLQLEDQTPNTTSNALMVISGTSNVELYEKQLIDAKDTKLPQLFEDIKEASSELTCWMKAESLPLMIQSDQLKSNMRKIDDRIFNISLYAGLMENIVRCSKGRPASKSEKLHIMQRRLYMDEECLLNYRTGGMEFDDIADYDKWISEPENRDRILPHPKCLVAMKVRRNEKKRDWSGGLIKLITQMKDADADKFTFLYMRNGENVYRLATQIEFDEKIFPDQSNFDPTEPMMAERFINAVTGLISVREYDELVKEWNAEEQKCNDQITKNKKWLKNNPGKTDDDNPDYEWVWMGSFGNPTRKYDRVDQSSVHYDDAIEFIADEIKRYNRISLIIQGLFDRSEIFNPHEPVQTWTSEGFVKAIELVYDGSNVLHHGDAPSFEQYRFECNQLITPESIFIGQDDFWMKKEAVKENNRRDNDYRCHTDHRVDTYKPYGNPGPGYLGSATNWKPRSRKATFEWTRERMKDTYYNNDRIPCKLIVPVDKLFNVSAYKLGDYYQFFNDPRTREQYLEWAPMLLAAEEYHANNS